MDRREFLAATVAGLTFGSSVARSARAGNNPPTATRNARVSNNVDWHDVRDWGVEGRAFNDTENYFDRLPGRAKSVVREAVWDLSRNTSGMAAFFESDAPEFYVRYNLLNERLAMAHMPATGVSGVDLYGMTTNGWRWLATHQPRSQANEARIVANVAPGRRAYHLNFPLYNGVTSMEIGVPKGATFVPKPPRKDKPILFYGTSITQGGCASRPGMCFTNILGRRLNCPMLNFGFSGNGKTEIEVAKFLVELDPAVFVLDTSANTPAEQLGERTEAVVKLIRKEHPATPVLLLDERQRGTTSLVPSALEQHHKQTEALRGAYENLKSAGVANLHFRIGDDVLGDDDEATVDGSHPTDLGMLRYAHALEADLRKLMTPA